MNGNTNAQLIIGLQTIIQCVLLANLALEDNMKHGMNHDILTCHSCSKDFGGHKYNMSIINTKGETKCVSACSIKCSSDIMEYYCRIHESRLEYVRNQTISKEFFI